MRIITRLLFCFVEVAGFAQVLLTGKVEPVPAGTFLILQADTRDTLAVGLIRNAAFSAELRIPEGPYAVPAMIMMVSEDRTRSQAAPLALSSGQIDLTVDGQGVVHYAGSALQDDFNAFLEGARVLVTDLAAVQDRTVRDSMSNLLGRQFDEYYDAYRETGLAWFNALWIADLVERKLIDPTGLALLRGRCGASAPVWLDSIPCAAISRYQEDWSGKVMPSFKAHNAAGDEILIEGSTLDGLTVIDFWASWCGPCLKEFPRLKAIYAEGGVRIITVSIDSRRQDWERILPKLEQSWLNLWDADGHVARAFQVTAVPAKFVIDKDGRVVSRNPDDLEGVLQKLMKK